MMQRALLALCLLFMTASAMAAEVLIDGTEDWPLRLAGKVTVLEDAPQSLSLETAVDLLDGSRPAPHGTVSRELPSGRSQSAWWLHTEIVNTGSEPLSLLVTPGTTWLKNVDFHIRQHQAWRTVHAGLAVPMSQQKNPSREPILDFVLAPGERVQLVLRAKSVRDIGLDPKLYTPAAFQAREARAALWDGALLGGLGALAWSVLLLYAFTRSKPFFWLGALSLNVALSEAAVRGYAHMYLWAEAAEWSYRSSTVMSVVSSILMIGFIFSLAEHEKIALPARRLFLAIAGVQSVILVMSVVGDVFLASRLLSHAGTVLRVCLVVVAAVLVWKRTPTGMAMLLATAFLFFNISLRLAQQQGVAPDFFVRLGNDIWPNPVIALLGLGFNLVVFTSWISLVGRQRRAAQDALANLQRNEQERLRSEVDRQTRALNEALQYAEEKNRQKTLTLGYISHDLRAPLATIAGYARLLSEQEGSGKQHVHAIERSVNYQLALIDELLEYTRTDLQPLEIRAVPTSLAALLDDIATYAATLAESRHNRFVYELASPLPQTAVIDGRRLQQVLLNLLSNAAKFTQHGEIRLRAHAARLEADWLLQFTVQDSGIGIDMAEQANIFDAFRQLQHAQGGVGLGLYIAQRIVQGMGSDLELSSSAGAGTTFMFTLRVPADGVFTVAPVVRTMFAPTRISNAEGRPAPPADSRLELAKLARDGRLTDIEHWLDTLSERHPAASDFYQEVRHLLHTLDLERVEALALAPDMQNEPGKRRGFREPLSAT